MPATSIAPEPRAAEHFGPWAPFVALDVRAASARTRERLGWEPTHPGLVHDTDQGLYAPAV